MVIKTFFDIEYTDAALDKQRAEQEKAGQPVSPRKFFHLSISSHPPSIEMKSGR